jgi:hypothetical protein
LDEADAARLSARPAPHLGRSDAPSPDICGKPKCRDDGKCDDGVVSTLGDAASPPPVSSTTASFRHTYVPRRRRRLWIERDTPIIPTAIARAVWHEASAWLDVELPREWIRRLAVRADVIYFHNPRFRRKIRGQGNTGRDWLFTRHWLAAMIRRRSTQLYARLPVSYSTGCDLPDQGQLSRNP